MKKPKIKEGQYRLEGSLKEIISLTRLVNGKEETVSKTVEDWLVKYTPFKIYEDDIFDVPKEIPQFKGTREQLENL
jgi:hypothetical protein